ncbi:NAD(P)H-binding protein [Microbacterium trichothecenolyticum]|uniref:NAD(P)H-binding protein n=1 Tax=Microbacterium trichothecenolyticum TaxID=69370 RepID=UPI001C6E529D|nr:NAD(P)H-binding protein [Microbacterium trichothecenolyticum]MBW9121821.1 NAD(P)H-binding protein [Microbacterium trichothecenolyticum]
MTILVTAAGGQFGHLVIDALLDRGVAAGDIVAGARTTSKAADLAERGIRVVPLDYDAPESVAAALEGVDAVLLISGSEPGRRYEGHVNVIDAAKAVGIAKVVYTSLAHADSIDFVLAPEHKATEEYLAASGVPAVVLRNNWYTENYTSDVLRAAETGVIAASVGDAAVAAASRADYAEAAAVVLIEDGHLGRTYELSGDTAVSYADLAAAAADVVARDVVYVPVTRGQLEAALVEAGLDAGTVGFVAEMEAGIARGVLADADPALASLLGRPTTPVIDGLRAAVEASRVNA